MSMLTKGIFQFAIVAVGLSYLPDRENDTIEYFDNCPVCNEELESMFISENASKRLDSKHIQNIMTESENWVIQQCTKYYEV